MTEAEQDALAAITQLFHPPKPPQPRVEAVVSEPDCEQKPTPPPAEQLKDLVCSLSAELSRHEDQALCNLRTVHEMEKSKGLVLANTKDFQQTCLVVLNKQHLLTNVVNEIETH